MVKKTISKEAEKAMRRVLEKEVAKVLRPVIKKAVDEAICQERKGQARTEINALTKSSSKKAALKKSVTKKASYRGPGMGR